LTLVSGFGLIGEGLVLIVGDGFRRDFLDVDNRGFLRLTSVFYARKYDASGEFHVLDGLGRAEAGQLVRGGQVDGRIEGSVATFDEEGGLKGRTMTEKEASMVLGHQLVPGLHREERMEGYRDPLLEPQMRNLCANGAIDCTTRRRRRRRQSVGRRQKRSAGRKRKTHKKRS